MVIIYIYIYIYIKLPILYSIKEFLKNSHILIPHKRMLFSAIVIGQVSNYTALL